MTENNNTMWWMYINNKKYSDPLTINEIKKYCFQIDLLDSEMFENLLLKGVALTFPKIKIRLKKYKKTKKTIENNSSLILTRETKLIKDEEI